MKLFSESLPFYKANFHCHTTCSDGQLTPEACMAFYRNAGYQVLSITDHRSVTKPRQVPEGLLMIPGIEIDYRLPEQWVHVLGLGMSERIGTEWDRNGTPQDGIDDINRLGGLAVLAHPAWSLNTPAYMASLTGLVGVEIWNSVSTIPHNADRADSSSLLDATWASGGALLPVYANDDAHFYDTEAGVAATMVQADSFTEAGIMEALRTGKFYATQGPEILQIEKKGNSEIIVRCSPAEIIIFYSNLPWAGNRTRMGHAMTEAVYSIQKGDRFVRVEIRDTEGRKAWSAPVPVN